MIAAMEAKPTKWATYLTSPDLDGVGTVIGMMKAVWKGHLRHGNPNEPLDVPSERCEMIVHSDRPAGSLVLIGMGGAGVQPFE